jgi:glycosyltransferase involved in cell wall biosynthesis
LFDRLLATRTSSATLPLLAFVAHLAAGQRRQAQRVARDRSSSSAAPEPTRRRLARLASAAGMPELAQELTASISGTPADLVALARTEFRSGLYRRALEHARQAEAAGTRGAASQATLAEGRLAVLQPGWTPDLGPLAGRLESLRGRTTRGRVLHFVSASLPFRVVGYTVRTQSVARSQAAAGLDPHVATRAGFPGNEGHHGAPEQEVIDGIPYHHLLPDFRSGRPDRGLIAGARAAVGLLEDLRPAVLQPASNHLMAQSAIALARPLGIPVVYEVRGFWEESWAAERSHDEGDARMTDRYRMTREAETAAMLDVDVVVTLSEVMRQEIVGRGCDPDRVVVVPNAVDHERFVPLPRDAALARTLGIEQGDLVVGYVSSLSAYEGIPGLLEAAAELRPRFPNLRVLIVGDGADAEVIRDTAARLGLDDGTLVMPGRVAHDEISRYYSLIDVFVVPRTFSRVASLVSPLKPFEAMALERAVVVSDLPALLETVVPGETALTYPAGDRAKLVEVLTTLLEDPALRARLGRRAREWVLEHRTWAANGHRYRALFERLGAA